MEDDLKKNKLIEDDLFFLLKNQNDNFKKMEDNLKKKLKNGRRPQKNGRRTNQPKST